MQAVMAKVVFNQKAQGCGLVFADNANGIQAILRDMVDDGGQNLMLHLPPLEQRVPCLPGVAMHTHPSLLRIGRAGVTAFCRGADKALTVVRRRVQQVSHDLFPRPSTVAPWGIGQLMG